MIDGQQTDVVSPDGTPLGPGLRGRYLLGADQNGRDVMVRLMYGGRTSIYIGVAGGGRSPPCSRWSSACCAGYYRGWIDSVLSRIMDVIWAFPVLLLGIALGTTLALGGLKHRRPADRRRLAVDSDPDHRSGLRAVHGPTDPR